MKTSAPRFVLASLSWVYVFGICALMLLEKIPADGISVGSFIIFIFIASIASNDGRGIKKGNKVEVNVAGMKYTGDALRVIDGANGYTYIFVDLTKVYFPPDEDEAKGDGKAPLSLNLKKLADSTKKKS